MVFDLMGCFIPRCHSKDLAFPKWAVVAALLLCPSLRGWDLLGDSSKFTSNSPEFWPSPKPSEERSKGLLIENFTFNRRDETAREDWGWGEFFLQQKSNELFKWKKFYTVQIIPDFQQEITKKTRWKKSENFHISCPSFPTKITASK